MADNNKTKEQEIRELIDFTFKPKDFKKRIRLEKASFITFWRKL
jgi:hypothetical protein